MPEEDLDSVELKEKIDQAVERLEEQRESTPWLRFLSLATAVIAVCAAVASLESGSYSNEAIIDKNEAILNQARASDQWAYYQAKGIKGIVTGTQAAVSSGDVAAKLSRDAERYAHEQGEIEKTARELEHKVAEANERAHRHLERHHKFALSVTVFQIAIAMCAIAALTRKRALFLMGLVGGVAGLAVFVVGLLHGLP
jgi:hypothetical protein